jgi:photosystem II stability/assembly factor-like uncharacterized protein
MNKSKFILMAAITIALAFTNASAWYSIAKNKIFHSPDNGKTWKELNKGLPDTTFPIRLYPFKNKIYLTTFSEGLFVLNKNDTVWKSLNSELFLRRSSMKQNPYRKISAFTVSDKDENHLFAATKHSLYESTDGGLKWKALPLSNLPEIMYITALNYSNNNLYLGTSFGGFYRVLNNSVESLSANLPYEPYSKVMNFYEQSSVIKSKLDSVYLGLYFGAGIFSSNKNKFAWKPFIDKNNFGAWDTVDDIDFTNDGLLISSGGSLYSAKNGKTTKDSSYKNILVNSEKPDGLLIDGIFIKFKKPSISLRERNKVSSAKKVVYTSLPYINKNLDYVLKHINNSELNSVIIDMKDDEGLVLFKSKNATAIEIKSVMAGIDISKIMKVLKENNIYTIARIVTFKDKMLYSAYSGKYAIKDSKTGLPWKASETEFWVDPNSEFVQNYNISLAKEIQDLGFDEIQFDYVRFPSYSQTGNAKYSFKKYPDAYKSEVITDFIRLAKKSLSAPVSVDIYGFTAWYYYGNSIGQDIEELSAYTDVLCPMVYPSHFGSLFYAKYPHDIRPYKIVLDGGLRSLALSDASTSIRPYIQGFDLMSPTWGTEYILHQINAAYESNNDGYSLWNTGENYKVPFDALEIKKQKDSKK